MHARAHTHISVSISHPIAEWKLLAQHLFQRPFDTATVGFSGKLTAADLKLMQQHAVGRMGEIVDLMRAMPPELNLLMRNINCIRAMNRDLGVPVNRYVAMGRFAARGCALPFSSSGRSYNHARFHIVNYYFSRLCYQTLTLYHFTLYLETTVEFFDDDDVSADAVESFLAKRASAVANSAVAKQPVQSSLLARCHSAIEYYRFEWLMHWQTWRAWFDAFMLKQVLWANGMLRIGDNGDDDDDDAGAALMKEFLTVA
jgi:hypothetical protein